MARKDYVADQVMVMMSLGADDGEERLVKGAPFKMLLQDLREDNERKAHVQFVIVWLRNTKESGKKN